MKIKAGIVGGAGYTGGELIRLLIHHPDVAVSFIHSRSNADKAVASVHQDLLGETDLQFTGSLSDDIDVLFLCVGHGEARKFLTANPIAKKIKIIDLSQDFRLQQHSTLDKKQFVYGLPELNKEARRLPVMPTLVGLLTLIQQTKKEITACHTLLMVSTSSR